MNKVLGISLAVSGIMGIMLAVALSFVYTNLSSCKTEIVAKDGELSRCKSELTKVKTEYANHRQLFDMVAKKHTDEQAKRDEAHEKIYQELQTKYEKLDDDFSSVVYSNRVLRSRVESLIGMVEMLEDAARKKDAATVVIKVPTDVNTQQLNKASMPVIPPFFEHQFKTDWALWKTRGEESSWMLALANQGFDYTRIKTIPLLLEVIKKIKNKRSEDQYLTFVAESHLPFFLFPKD